jgi:hypothetical protein
MTVKRLLAWSYSRLDLWLTCPRRCFLKHIQKLVEPPSPPLERGSRIHKLAEDYLKGILKKLPSELKLLKAEFAVLAKLRKRLQIEAELAFALHWGLSGWFDPDCWCRIKMDVMYDDPKETQIRRVIDWKTGKMNPKHTEQTELYAIGAFLTAPKNIIRVDTKLAYTDSGEVVEQTFMRTDLPKLQKKWEKLAVPMLRDTKFKPTPSSNACRFCPWTKVLGGPCTF